MTLLFLRLSTVLSTVLTADEARTAGLGMPAIYHTLIYYLHEFNTSSIEF